MRILLVHPNYHSGGAEIAGNWPPAWVAYLTGAAKSAGYDDVHFIDAMTDHVEDDDLRARIADLKPDLVGVTSITPSIYKAERVLQLAKEAHPEAVRVLGGVHATFMYKQVLSEAPEVDVIVRGEGEEIFVTLCRAIAEGRWPADQSTIKGIAYRDGTEIVATEAAPTIKDLETIKPDWSILNWERYVYIPLGTRLAIPNMARGCPFTCSFCSQWKFWRDYRVRDPKKVVDEIEDLVDNHGVGFFILADEEPTINRKKFVEFCEELIRRGLPDRVKWGINTRVTDIQRDKDLLPLWRKAGLVHISLGTEAAAQMKLDLFNKGNPRRGEQGSDPAPARSGYLHRGAVHRRPRQRDRRDARRDLSLRARLESGSRELDHVYALAVHPALSGRSATRSKSSILRNIISSPRS